MHLSFLDSELLSLVRDASRRLRVDGFADDRVVHQFEDGVHLQPWPNHIDHMHIRFLEDGSQFADGYDMEGNYQRDPIDERTERTHGC